VPFPRGHRVHHLAEARGAVGAVEHELAEALTKRGWTFSRQYGIEQPADGTGTHWRVDFARWPLAVELTWYSADPLWGNRRKRTMHILNKGWYLLYIAVWSPTLALFDTAAELVIERALAIERGENVPRLMVAEAKMKIIDREWQPVIDLKDPWAADGRRAVAHC
jgi:hypothetical protein